MEETLGGGFGGLEGLGRSRGFHEGSWEREKITRSMLGGNLFRVNAPSKIQPFSGTDPHPTSRLADLHIH